MAKTETKTQDAGFAAMNTFASTATETARTNMERSMAVLGDFSALQKQQLAMMAESAKVATKTMEVMTTRASQYARDIVEDMMTAQRSVTSAKTVKEAIELQAQFAKSSFDRYVEEMNAMTGLFANSMKQVVEPMNAQAGEFVAMMQRRV
jgi:phasin family protein